jgi:hypothetical protein
MTVKSAMYTASPMATSEGRITTVECRPNLDQPAQGSFHRNVGCQHFVSRLSGSGWNRAVWNPSDALVTLGGR